MFKKKNEEPKLVGATEKLAAAAERMRNAARGDAEKARGTENGSQAIPVALIFVMAASLAMMMLDGNPAGIGLHPTGVMGIDKALFGSGIQKFTGDADVNRMIIILIRAAAIFLLAAAPPFFAFLLSHLWGKERLNPFVACWGALIALLLFFYSLHDVIGSLLRDALRGL